MNGIEFEGLEEFISFTEEINISEYKKKQALRKGIEHLSNQIKQYIPKRTGKLSNTKIKVVNKNEIIEGTLSLGAFYDKFNEFGTSKSKKNIGFFTNAIEKHQNEAIEIVSKDILDNL